MSGESGGAPSVILRWVVTKRVLAVRGSGPWSWTWNPLRRAALGGLLAFVSALSR